MPTTRDRADRSSDRATDPPLDLARYQARAQQLEAAGRRDLPPTPAVTTPAGRPCWYPDTAILTDEDVATALGVSVKTVRGWGIRRLYPGVQTIRYFWRDVVAYLDESGR